MLKKYSLIVLVLIIGVLAVGCSQKKSMSLPIVNNSSANKPVFVPLSDSQDGVDVTVENIKRENGKTIIELALNNHLYDLSTFDAVSRSSFAGVKPSEYKIKDGAAGGHHLQAEMIFGGELSGPLTIGLGDSLTFNFNIQ